MTLLKRMAWIVDDGVIRTSSIRCFRRTGTPTMLWLWLKANSGLTRVDDLSRTFANTASKHLGRQHAACSCCNASSDSCRKV